MVNGHGGRLWLWLVLVVICALRSGVAEAQQQYVNESFPAPPIENLLSYEQSIQQAAYTAFQSLNPVTGFTYNTSLTGDLANITVQAVRLRVGSLRRYGVTLGKFIIPPMSLRITNVSSVRVILVYRDLGNVSVYSASVPGQVFVSSLVGIRVYNGDTLNSDTPLPALTAIALDNPIQVIIPPNAQPSYCVEFSRTDPNNGTAFATNVTVNETTTPPTYACFSRTLGDNYFALVGVPPPPPPLPPPLSSPPKKKSNTWKIILGTVLGVVGLIAILLLLVLCCRRQLRKRKLAKMQAQADRGETLQPTQVGNTRAPVATQSRTRPRLEKDLNVT